MSEVSMSVCRRLIVISAVLAGALSGCATAPPPPPPAGTLPPAPKALKAPTAAPAATRSASTPQTVDITPLHDFKERWGEPTEAGANFSGQYTRLLITARVSGNGSDSSTLPYIPRNILHRALWGKEFNFVLTAKLRIPDTLEFTVPLAIIGHQSNSNGETWLRELSIERRDFPLFLVKRDGRTSNPSLSAEVKGSNTYTSRGAAAGISALARVSQLTGAAPSVITQLTKDSTKAAATQFDLALSNLLASSVTERTNSDRPLAHWPAESRKSPKGLEIILKVPKGGDWDDQKLMEVGRWIISFAAPRPSVFSDWSVCTVPQSDEANLNAIRCSRTISEAQSKVRAEVQPSEILNFDLVNGASQKLGTIRAFLAQQEWFTTAVVAFSGTSDEAVDNASNLFCRRVINEITALDLSEFDARLVLWAVYKGMPVNFPSRFKSAADCKDSTGNSPTVRTEPVVTTVPS